MNEKFTLAFDEFIHVGYVLVIVIALVAILTGFIRAYIPQEKLQEMLSKNRRFGSLTGALLGVPTPFCSASMVPVSMGMIEMGAPFSMVFSFLISAPLANFVVVGLILGAFGWKVALTYFLIVFIGAILFGTIVGNSKISKEVKLISFGNKSGNNSSCEVDTAELDCSGNTNKKVAGLTCDTGKTIFSKISNPKLRDAFEFAMALFKRIIPYVLLGAAISAVCAAFVPDAWVERYLGNNNPIAIPMAAAIGVPLYLRIEMAIPLLQILIVKGMSMGAAIALIIGGTGASLPELAIISSMLKPKAIIAFVLSIMTLGITGGFIFYFFF